MGAKGIWLGNKAWPSNQSCGQFAEDCFRIAGAKTDKEKALAFYDWFTRCMMRGQNLMKPDGAGGYSRSYDPLSTLTSWGFGECTFWGWTATECLRAAGLRTRRVVVHKQGHTYHEVFYKGDDGVEQWHAFDPFGGWYFLNESGEVASCAELAANPQLAQNPLPGHPTPLGHHPDRGNLAHRHRTEDQVIIDQPIRNESLEWDMKKGMQVTATFMPEAPHDALLSRNPAPGDTSEDAWLDGACGDMTPIGKLGFQQYTEHMPYWQNYMWPTRNTTRWNEGRPVRWNGAGALRWKPLQQTLDVTEDAYFAKLENGALSPTGPHDFCEVWYHFKLPFLVSWLKIDYDVAGAGDDYFGLALSADGRRSWWPMPMRKGNSPHWSSTSNGQTQWKAGESSLQGLQEFWLRVDMISHHENPTLKMQALDISVGFQHNMYIQPRLLPGENPLWLTADQVDDNTKLTAEWIYQQDREEHRVGLSLDSAGEATETVSLDAPSPADIRMTGIKLNCT